MINITENTRGKSAIKPLERLVHQSRRDEIFVIKETTQIPSSVGAKQNK